MSSAFLVLDDGDALLEGVPWAVESRLAPRPLLGGEGSPPTAGGGLDESAGGIQLQGSSLGDGEPDEPPHHGHVSLPGTHDQDRSS